MNDDKIKIGITQGDTNGVGYELIIKTLSDLRILDFCTPVVYGSQKMAAFYGKTIEDCVFNAQIISDISSCNTKRINLINCMDKEVKVEPGLESEEAGRAAYTSLDRAMQDLKNRQIDTLLTAPLNKNIIPADINFGSQSQFLENALGEKGQSLPLLINDIVRIAVAVPPQTELSKDLILVKLRKLKQSLLQDFSINLPRIAVLKLGENDEQTLISAIEDAENEGIICFGTYEVEDFFHLKKFKKFDAVLAMNNEQVKPFLRGNDVCYAAGLSTVITASAQGVNYGNAGKNLTSEEAFRNALYAAVDICRSRKFYKAISTHPLSIKSKK